MYTALSFIIKNFIKYIYLKFIQYCILYTIFKNYTCFFTSRWAVYNGSDFWNGNFQDIFAFYDQENALTPMILRRCMCACVYKFVHPWFFFPDQYSANKKCHWLRWSVDWSELTSIWSEIPSHLVESFRVFYGYD